MHVHRGSGGSSDAQVARLGTERRLATPIGLHDFGALAWLVILIVKSFGWRLIGLLLWCWVGWLALVEGVELHFGLWHVIRPDIDPWNLERWRRSCGDVIARYGVLESGRIIGLPDLLPGAL